MEFVKRKWIWLKRFRHRRGYGVHSPFAFDFLTYVVYEKGEYYAYRELKKRCRKMEGGWSGRMEKCCKFLFRLANYVQPDAICLYGHIGDARAEYLAAGCATAAVCRQTEGQHQTGFPERDTGAGQTELVVVAGSVPCSEWQAIAAGIAPGKSVCVLSGIHASAEALEAWKSVKKLPAVMVSLDLYDYGLLFYDTSKQRQHYIVNF